MNVHAMLTGAPGWFPYLVEVAAKATVVLLLTALAAALLWKASAAVRHMVWSVGIASVLALPLASPLLPSWEARVLPAAALPTGAAEAAAAPVGAPFAAVGEWGATDPLPAPAESSGWAAGFAAVVAGGVVLGLF
jgi:hypothetical protein